MKIPYKDSYTAREQEKIYDEFKLEVGALAGVKVANGMTAKQLIESRTQYLRSQNFVSLLERSPENFLYTMARLEPELAQTVSSKNGGTLSAYDFYFNDDKLSLLGEEDLIKRRAQRNVWKGRWTDSKSYLGEPHDKDFKNYYNFDRLKEVAYFWHRYYMQAAVNDEGKLSGEKITSAQDKFFERMSAATRRVMMRNGSAMTKDDIIKKGEGDDKDGRMLAELFLNDQNGFIKQMQRLNENFGDAKTPGEKKFFYWIANRWFNHDFRGGVIPTENDIKMSPMTVRATETWSETLFADGYGRATAWNENAVKALADIDNVLLKAATEKNISGIIQLHEKIHTLRGMVGIDVSKFHYFIATAVIRFYQRDYRLRAPWPFNWWIYSLPLEAYGWGRDIDKDMTLSTRYKSYGAMQFTEENIREYGTYLTKRGFMKAYGDWSRDVLWNNLGADRKKYLALQAAPSIFFMSTSMTMGDLVMSAVNEFAGDIAGTKK